MPVSAPSYAFYSPRFRPLDDNGEILPSAYMNFYETGTVTKATIYADADLTTPLDNPITADASGEFAAIYLDPAVTYRVQLYDSGDVLQWDEDPIAPLRDYPPGTVVWFYGTEAELETAYPPSLWQQLDGNNGTPDGQDRHPIIAGTTYSPGDTGGSSGSVMTDAAGGHDHGGATGGHTLVESEIPAHNHRVWSDNDSVDTATHGLGSGVARAVAGRSAAVTNVYVDQSGATAAQLIEDTGGDGSHDHSISSVADHQHSVSVTAPYVALWAVMRRDV